MVSASMLPCGKAEEVAPSITPNDANADDSMVRSAREQGRRAWSRIPLSVVASGFLFTYVDAIAGFSWLACIIALELIYAFFRAKVAAGQLKYRVPCLIGLLFISICWVAHATALWFRPDEIARIAALMDLFTIALYAAIGGHKDKGLLLVLVLPPLAALSGLLLFTIWTSAPFVTALYASAASLGACATILANAFAMHRADRDLLRANRELRAANAAKQQFLANMSHEIRTPLNGIVGIVGALDRTALSGAQREMVQLIQSSGQTLERLLTDILDMSKIGAGKLDLHIEAFDVRRAVESAAALMRVRAEDKGIGFSLEFSPAINGEFMGDADRVRQIVANLASNAVKFTNQGSVAIKAEVEDQAERTEVVISFEDTGIGFDQKTLTHLFGRFNQAEADTATRNGGTGLGLSISKSLAQMMGGEITATSTPNVGSRFVLRLPLQRATPLRRGEAQREDAAAPDAIAEDLPSEANTVRVLLAEDHPTNQRVVSLILEPFGVDLTIVDNGAQAVEAFSSGSFDLVLMDLRMPVMDGLEATRCIRAWESVQRAKPTPIVMLSASAMREQVDAALEAGCDAHVTKPVTPAGLIESVRAVLSRAAESRVAHAVKAA